MSSDKTTRFPRLGYQEVAPNDLLPIIDVTGITSKTGESKAITITSSIEYMDNAGLLDWVSIPRGNKTANGLWFDSTFTPTDVNGYCRGFGPSLGNAFSMVVRAYVPTASFTTSSVERALFGVAPNASASAATINEAFIGALGYDLIGYVSGLPAYLTYTNFFKTYRDGVFVSTLTVSGGYANLYVNDRLISSLPGIIPSIPTGEIFMGNGTPTQKNLNCTIYEAAVYNDALDLKSVGRGFITGVDVSDTRLIAAYTSVNLNPGPTQWIDAVNGYNLLLPTSGAFATNPNGEFHLRFKNSGVSGYLGNGTKRDVLPKNYVLTDCFVYSSGAPLISVGSTASAMPAGQSAVFSWNNNRVLLTSASFSRTNLELETLGVAHKDRSLYVYFSSSAAPCTFSFDGYVADYGQVYWTPGPTPGPTPTPTTTPPPTPAPTTTPVPTPTPGPTSTPGPTGTPAPTATPGPTATPTPTPSPTPTPTPTPTPSATGATPTPTPSATPTLYNLSVNGGQPGVVAAIGGGSYPAGASVGITASFSGGYALWYWSTTPTLTVTDNSNNGTSWYATITMPAYAQSITPVGQGLPTPTPSPTPSPTPTPTPSATPAPLFANISDQIFGETPTSGVNTTKYRLNTNGNAEIFETPVGSYQQIPGEWRVSGSSFEFEARANYTGDVPTTGTTGTWLNLSSSVEWTLTAAGSGQAFNTILAVDIRMASSPFTVLTSASINMSAERL